MSIEAEIPVSFHTSDNWLVGPSTAVLNNYSYNKDEVGKCTLAQWEKEWNESKSGKFTKLFFPNVDEAAVLKFRPLSLQITQKLTGHSLLNAHLFRFGFKVSQACSCGFHSENVTHFPLVSKLQ